MEHGLNELKGKKSNVSAEGDETEDYVRVKAKRGEATDSHSIAERARRAQIRMRMKLLQSLVPGCDKITGNAQILDEIIKYVQLLQNQVESLAAQLAFVDLMLYDCELNYTANACVPGGMMQFGPESCSIPSFADGVPSESASVLLTADQTDQIPQYGADFLLEMEDWPEAIRPLVNLQSSDN